MSLKFNVDEVAGGSTKHSFEGICVYTVVAGKKKLIGRTTNKTSIAAFIFLVPILSEDGKMVFHCLFLLFCLF